MFYVIDYQPTNEDDISMGIRYVEDGPGKIVGVFHTFVEAMQFAMHYEEQR